jgi:transposase-like protein
VPAPYLTVPQLAERLGVKPKTIYKWRHKVMAAPRTQVRQEPVLALVDVEAWEATRREEPDLRRRSGLKFR